MENVAGIDIESSVVRGQFAELLREARPDLFARLEGGEDGALSGKVSVTIAAGLLRIISEIPDVAEAMLTGIDRRNTEPAVRCALSGALAYLISPRDLLPDDLPGGYGFVDDCMILRATVSEFLSFLPKGFTTVEREKRLLEFLAVSIAPASLPQFQAEVEGIWLTFHVLLWESEETVEKLSERFIEDPMGTLLPELNRESIPLPPGPRLSMAPGDEIIEFDGDNLVIRFARGGAVHLDPDGRIVSWE